TTPLRLTCKKVGRIVLDADQLAAFDRFPADERVASFIEFEAEEIRRGNELGLTRLADQTVEIARRLVGRCGRRVARRPLSAAVAFLFAPQKIVLILPSFR